MGFFVMEVMRAGFRVIASNFTLKSGLKSLWHHGIVLHYKIRQVDVGAVRFYVDALVVLNEPRAPRLGRHLQPNPMTRHGKLRRQFHVLIIVIIQLLILDLLPHRRSRDDCRLVAFCVDHFFAN